MLYEVITQVEDPVFLGDGSPGQGQPGGVGGQRKVYLVDCDESFQETGNGFLLGFAIVLDVVITSYSIHYTKLYEG